MADNEFEPRDFVKWMFNKYHARRIEEQQTDQEYYDDEFQTSIVAPFHVVRTGSASRIVDNIVNHIETANPRVFRKPRNNSVKEKESNLRVSSLLNNWAERFIGELTEAIWCASLRGEGLFQISFNPTAYDKIDRDYVYRGDDLPIIITSPDPLYTACFPYDALIPEKVAKQFRMEKAVVESMYPAWIPKKLRGKGSSEVDYEAYYDKNKLYFCGGEVVIENKPNVLGFVPFVHFHSGFGKLSPTGDPSTMAVGRLRKIRGRLKEECEIESRIDSIIGLYANPILQISQTQKDADKVDGKALENTVLAPGTVIKTGWGWNQNIYVPEVATAQLFAHLSQVRAALGLEDPPIMSGLSSNSRSTGRQEDIEFEHIQKKYVKLIHNAEIAFATCLSMGLKILYEQPQALPVTTMGTIIQDNGTRIVKEMQITKEDIDGYFDCSVTLDPEEATEDDRNFMKHRMLVNEGRESWRRFLIEGCGKTEEESDDIMAETLAEQAIMNNPLLKAAREEEALKQMGADRYVQQVKQDSTMQRDMQQALQGYQPNQGYRPTEARNPAALDKVRGMFNGEATKGMRPSPQLTEIQQ